MVPCPPREFRESRLPHLPAEAQIVGRLTPLPGDPRSAYAALDSAFPALNSHPWRIFASAKASLLRLWSMEASEKQLGAIPAWQAFSKLSSARVLSAAVPCPDR